MNGYTPLILVLLLGLGCAAPSTTHTECAEMCRADGKKVKLYETAPFAVRCECADQPQPSDP